MGDLDGQRIVVTGATSGLGAAITSALLEAGATVALASRPTERLGQAVARWREQGWRAEALPIDVRDPASVTQAAAGAGRLLGGGVDLVVNNAGIGMRTVNSRFFDTPMPFFEVPLSGFADMVATNLTGYFLVAKAFSPLFVDQGHGRFVNITMNHETMQRRGFVPYGPARAGAESLSLIMVEDLRPYGITVNQLLPGGATATGMIPDDMPGTLRDRLLPPHIMGPPAVFLASVEAEGLTGARIAANQFDRWLGDFRRDRQA